MSVTGSASSTNNLNCLKGKIKSLSPYAVDKTLSVEGASADAMSVGEALEKKVSYTDIVDNIVTSEANVPLSAKQGVVLKKFIDTLQVNTEESFANTERTISELSESLKGAQNSADNAQTTADNAQMSADDAKTTADKAIADALPKLGGVMEGDIDMGGFKLVGLSDPTNNNEAVNKAYADQIDTKVREVKYGGTGKSSVTAGSFLVGDGTDALVEKTPEEVAKMLPISAGGGLTITKLWENASPASTFAAQTVTIEGLSEYPYIGINFNWIQGTELQISGIQTFINSDLFLHWAFMSAKTGNYHRPFNISGDGLVFTAGEGSNTGKSVIPFQIYGIK